MRRREFISLLSAAAVEWSSRVQAEQQAIPVVGYLSLGSGRGMQPFADAFLSGLASHGYIEGKNIQVLHRFADGHTDRLSPLTTELVSLGARVIVTQGGASIEAAHKAAPSVPVVSTIGPDPVGMGWAKSLAKPGGMITGIFSNTQAPKKLELNGLKRQRRDWAWSFVHRDPQQCAPAPLLVVGDAFIELRREVSRPPRHAAPAANWNQHRAQLRGAIDRV